MTVTHKNTFYKGRLVIEGTEDEFQALNTVINEVIDLVNSFKASIRNFNVSENNRQGVYDITMKIAVPGNLELDKVLSQLRNLRNVIKVTRS